MAAGEEKILVSVRVRPLNEKEKTRNDRCDWECINNTTIICKYHNLPDKSSYTFDKVFGFECPTKQVYNDGAKEVALCVLAGINSSIFAYGQTSSGKTYTMGGITEFAMDDIFGYIEKHKQEREFTLKFSAMEIYNEAVRDLLCEDSNTPLRLLDDPERGTVVEKLREETLTDRNHLEELLSICETQRKIGETSMNETSSRSHQILRLTIESLGRKSSRESSATLAASVCFVDLAGSERASQTLSAGSRLKEGCHINRSLLTLGTVIRKLSQGKSGHIPYRDSKLTRILQNSLGGNARTAIICTMSPARSHLEQSRNTLLFASCAKEVTTNAQVNMVVSEKALVKQLQRELARMENELKNLAPASSSSTSEFYALLKQKEELIAKMEEQIQELKWQRDVAQSRVENLLKSTAEERSSSSSTDNRRRSYDSTDFEEPRMLSNLGKSNLYTLENPDEYGFQELKWQQESQVEKLQNSTAEERSSSTSIDNRRRSYDSTDSCEPPMLNIMRKNDLYSPDEDGFLLEDTTPQFPGHDQYDKWEEITKSTIQELEDACKEVRCIEVNSGETERVKIQESLDDIVEKKVEPLLAEQDSKCFPAAENEGMDSKKEEEEKYQIQDSLDNIVEKKVEPLSAEQDCKSFAVDENSENEEAMESKEENADSSLKTIDIEFSPYAKLEAKDELTIKKIVEVQETEQSAEKEDKIMSSLKKEDIDKNLWKEESEKLVENYGDSDRDAKTYEALKKKVKEMQKTIDYFMSMQTAEQKQSPSFKTDDNMSPGDYFKMKRSRSCRDNLLFRRASASGRFVFKTSNNTSFDSDNTIDTPSMKDSDTETSNSSFHEFLAGLKEMAMQHESTHDLDAETENMKPENREDGSVSGEKAEFERQRSQIIELWEVCNVPLVHRTYFILLFKGDPSDFVYMEVELRRLSFLKDSPETLRKQTAKALTREREWLAKQIPKKFGKKPREEVYKKWGVELSSKQRSLQVTHKLWINTKDLEHCKESASLVASLVGFVDTNLTPKEMFGLSFSPTIFNIKPSGWRFTNSFSRISLTGGL